MFDQIKQEVKSEAFKKHWILPQCERNSSKEKKTPLKIPALFPFLAHDFQHYLAKFSALFSIFLRILPDALLKGEVKRQLIFTSKVEIKSNADIHNWSIEHLSGHTYQFRCQLQKSFSSYCSGVK